MKKGLLCAILFLVVLCIGLCMGKQKGKIFLEETESGKAVVLYDGQTHRMETIPVIEKTSVTPITDTMYEITQSVGSPARYVFYYDMKNGNVSDVYFNPILISAGNEPSRYVAYMKDGVLFACDIFNKHIFCEKIERNFTKTADPVSAVIDITLEEEGRLALKYYQGDAYNVVTETITLSL